MSGHVFFTSEWLLAKTMCHLSNHTGNSAEPAYCSKQNFIGVYHRKKTHIQGEKRKEKRYLEDLKVID